MKKKMPARRQRLYFVLFSGLCLVFAAVLILNAFQDNIVFFRTPTDLMTKPARIGEQIRIGGLVKTGTLKKNQDGSVEFVVTDKANDLIVKYSGTLPSLFREGQGVVAYGTLQSDRSFKASEILAKHDEKYMPPEVYKELKDRGYLRP
jgi:cytochrome c-type biogenesis protein CcmE